MNIQLSQKERMLLEDQKHQEDVCVKKYRHYANETHDSELRQLFNKIASEEQQHSNTLDQILHGQAPNINQGQTQQPATFQNAAGNANDEIICSDLLATEKYASSTYDTTVFESTDPVVTQALQHIQQDEQRHGKELFNYMHSHGMYNVQ